MCFGTLGTLGREPFLALDTLCLVQAMQEGTVLVLLTQTFLHCGPSSAKHFWFFFIRKKHGVNGSSVNLQTIIQRGECAHLSANTVVKKSLSLIAFGIYSNDLLRRVLRCQGFFISNIFPNKIFVKIG